MRNNTYRSYRLHLSIYFLRDIYLGFVLLVLDLFSFVMLELLLRLFQLLLQLDILLLQTHFLLVIQLLLILDLLGPYRKLNRRQSLLMIILIHRASCDDRCLGIRRQGVLQNAGQFGVPVGDVIGPVGQGVDYIAQARQGQVDFFCLLEGLASDAAFSDFLASSQINKAQLRPEILPPTLEIPIHKQYRMTSRTNIIIHRSRNFPSLMPHPYQIQQLSLIINLYLLKPV